MGAVIESRFSKESIEFHSSFVEFIQEQADPKKPIIQMEQDASSVSTEVQKFRHDSWLTNKLVPFFNEYGTIIFISVGILLLTLHFCSEGEMGRRTRLLEIEISGLRLEISKLVDVIKKEIRA